MKKFQKDWLLRTAVWTVSAVLLTLLVGCAGSPGRTGKEIDQRHMDTVQTQWLQMQDDIDAFLLLDRPSRLSEMYTR